MLVTCTLSCSLTCPHSHTRTLTLSDTRLQRCSPPCSRPPPAHPPPASPSQPARSPSLLTSGASPAPSSRSPRSLRFRWMDGLGKGGGGVGACSALKNWRTHARERVHERAGTGDGTRGRRESKVPLALRRRSVTSLLVVILLHLFFYASKNKRTQSELSLVLDEPN